jgi:hypothetical protein
MHKWGSGNFNRIYNNEYLSLLTKSYYDWMKFNDKHAAGYEEIKGDISNEVKKIAEFLEIEINREDCLRISEELSFQRQKKEILNGSYLKTAAGEMEKTTLLHTNHLRSGEINQWKHELTTFQIARIQRDWKVWMIANGYKLHPTLLNYRWVFNGYGALRTIYSKLRRVYASI